jgi:hypothetical protein
MPKRAFENLYCLIGNKTLLFDVSGKIPVDRTQAVC